MLRSISSVNLISSQVKPLILGLASELDDVLEVVDDLALVEVHDVELDDNF